MNSVFNTVFEVSLRVLLILEASPSQWRTPDWIAAADFIAVYGKDFGIAGENLHGDNSYKYSEFALRRELVKKALKSLALRRLVDVRTTSGGFVYALSRLGGDYCAEFAGGYANEYRDLAIAVKTYTDGKTEREIIGLINRRSISSLQRNDGNG